MSHRPTVYVSNLAVCMSDADSKVVEVILKSGAHFAARKVTGRNDANAAPKNEHRQDPLVTGESLQYAHNCSNKGQSGDIWDS